MSICHVADAEVEFEILNVTPDFCRVGDTIVPFDISQKLKPEKLDYAKSVTARDAPVLMVKSIVEGVKSNAGGGVASQVSLGDGHSEIRPNNATVYVEDRKIARHLDLVDMNGPIAGATLPTTGSDSTSSGSTSKTGPTQIEQSEEPFDNAGKLREAMGGAKGDATSEQLAKKAEDKDFSKRGDEETSFVGAMLGRVGLSDKSSEIRRTFSVPPGEQYDGLRNMLDPETFALKKDVSQEDFYQAAINADLRMVVQDNGLNNGIMQAYSNGYALSRELAQSPQGPALIVNVYNPTHGKTLDTIESGTIMIWGIDTSAVGATKVAVADALKYNNKLANHRNGDVEGPILPVYTEVWGHSEGSIIANEAVAELSDNQRAMVNLRNVGTAANSTPSNLHTYTGVGNTNDFVYSGVSRVIGAGGVQTSRNFDADKYKFVETNFEVVKKDPVTGVVGSAGDANHSFQYYMQDPKTRDAFEFSKKPSPELQQFYKKSPWVKGE